MEEGEERRMKAWKGDRGTENAELLPSIKIIIQPGKDEAHFKALTKTYFNIFQNGNKPKFCDMNQKYLKLWINFSENLSIR